MNREELDELKVAPFVGAWIETNQRHKGARVPKSLPSWERGLKHETGYTV